MRDDRVRADDGAVSVPPTGRRRTAAAPAGVGPMSVGASATGVCIVLLVPALSRGAPHGPPAGRPRAGFGHAGADAGSAMAKRPLVARLRRRSVH